MLKKRREYTTLLARFLKHFQNHIVKMLLKKYAWQSNIDLMVYTIQ